MSIADKRKMCSGCTENFYNGNNPYGVQECWNLKTAKVVMKKFVHVDQVPPWTQRAEKTLSCCHRERYVKVDPDVVR